MFTTKIFPIHPLHPSNLQHTSPILPYRPLATHSSVTPPLPFAFLPLIHFTSFTFTYLCQQPTLLPSFTQSHFTFYTRRFHIFRRDT